ncbi:MAG: 2-dehydropantoate 2-reductase [Clostridiales bacterium]|nr:2-dehydropantoate 2-reductase [Clostridiales bacterium]MCF8022046.1 2-dehydropantoate 2-reductase [Clostridiales bacterium]
MKIGVIGAGSMGSLFGGLLSKSGEEVWLIDVWKEHIEKINENGLMVDTGDKEEVIKVNATDTPEKAGYVDLIIVFVKGLHTEIALKNAAPMINDNTYILTVQNGIGNTDVISRFVDEEKILFGMTTLSCDLKGPGHIEFTCTTKGNTPVKPLKAEVNDEILNIVDTFQKAGINLNISYEVERDIWNKLIVNCSLNTITAITRLNCGHFADQEGSEFLLSSVTKEIVDVANAKGIEMDYETSFEHLKKVAYENYGHYPSMVFDFKNKRKTEIEMINGAIVREAKKHNIPVPVNTVLLNLIKVMENTYSYQLF